METKCHLNIFFMVFMFIVFFLESGDSVTLCFSGVGEIERGYMGF